MSDGYELYQRWAIAPLMSREEWEAHQARIKEQAQSGTLSSNPYEWGISPETLAELKAR